MTHFFDGSLEKGLLPYPVIVASGALNSLAELVQKHAPAHKYAAIVDSQVDSLYGERLRTVLGKLGAGFFSIPKGEENKNLTEWARLSNEILAWGAGRDTTVIAIGGGVTGDIAGFVAATLHRGVRLVHVPTTLLAMVDSSLGGKTGVDTTHGKNLIGAFHDPGLVVSDIDVLNSLPPGIRRDGLAEMIKHGLIADADVFSELCAALPELSDASGSGHPSLREMIIRSMSIKASVVNRDRLESGLRQTLNAGHTIAHAIEHCLDFGISHGSAVAAGLVVEARLAELLGLASSGLADSVADAVLRAGLPDGPPISLSDTQVLEATRSDKKSRSGKVRYSLATSIGSMYAGDDGSWSVAVDDATVIFALSESRKFSRRPASRTN